MEMITDQDGFKLAIAEPAPGLEALKLHPVERERLKQKAVSDRLLSASALALAKDLSGAREPLRHDDGGRPYFSNAPWSISLSHKADRVAAAVASSPARVGVDIERIDAIREPQVFARYALTDSEIEALPEFARHWHLDESVTLVALWALKESYFKARSIDLIPQSMRFRLEDERLHADEWTPTGWREFAFRTCEVHTRGAHLIAVFVYE